MPVSSDGWIHVTQTYQKRAEEAITRDGTAVKS